MKLKSIFKALTATTKRKIIVTGVVAVAGAAGVSNAEKFGPIADALLTILPAVI